jgi:hypothetical protein
MLPPQRWRRWLRHAYAAALIVVIVVLKLSAAQLLSAHHAPISGPAATPARGSCAAVNAFLVMWTASPKLSTVAGAEADMPAFKSGFSSIGIPFSSSKLGWAAANVVNTTTKLSFDLDEYHGLPAADLRAWVNAITAIGTDCHTPVSVIHSVIGF